MKCPHCKQEMLEPIIWCPDRPVNYDTLDSCTTLTDSTTLDDEHYKNRMGYE